MRKTISFGEKSTEYCQRTNKNVPVTQRDRYKVAKQKALDLLGKTEYGLTEADFWILINFNKDGSAAYYNGLIISHNGCLKINDALKEEDKFKPSCVSLDKQGYASSLVYSYCNDEQGIFEVGEVSTKNCKNDYPYAMAFKRLFDRVVLKSSKIAFDGIYSEAESDEFAERDNEPPAPKKRQSAPPTQPQQQKETESQIEYVLEADVKRLCRMLREKNITQKSVCDKYHINSLRKLTMEQYEEICNSLMG